MDWIRRNWPDLLIGVALVAVIAMIVATLLSGGSLTSLLRRNTAPEIPITNTTGSGTTQTSEAPDETTQTPTASGSGTSSTKGSATEGNGSQSGNLDVFVPGTADAPETAVQDDTSATQDTADENVDTPSEGAGTAANSPAGAASVNAPLPESVINGGFRVAAGAVDSRDGALAAAQTFRDAGYTVTVEPQGDLYLLWIGPYASDAGAERVVARLQTDGLVPDALVYTYDPNEASASEGDAGTDAAETAAATGNANAGNTNTGNAAPGNTTTGNVGADSATAGDATENTAADAAGNATTAPETATTPASEADSLTPPAGQRFLQVGAYSSDERAEPQRLQVEGLGLSVTSDEDDDGVVRLYVGPFADAQLAQTRNRLNSQGIDSFPVTP